MLTLFQTLRLGDTTAHATYSTGAAHSQDMDYQSASGYMVTLSPLQQVGKAADLSIESVQVDVSDDRHATSGPGTTLAIEHDDFSDLPGIAHTFRQVPVVASAGHESEALASICARGGLAHVM